MFCLNVIYEFPVEIVTTTINEWTPIIHPKSEPTKLQAALQSKLDI